MFSNLKSFISGASPLECNRDGAPSTRDMQLAVMALLFTVIKAEQKHASSELERLFATICLQFDISLESASEIFEIAEFMLRENENRVAEFTEVVNQNFSVEQKIRILGLAWKIASADQNLSKAELDIVT